MRTHNTVEQVDGNDVVTISGGDTVSCNTEMFIAADGYLGVSTTSDGNISLSAGGAVAIAATGNGDIVDISVAENGQIRLRGPIVHHSSSDFTIADGYITADSNFDLTAGTSMTLDATTGSLTVTSGAATSVTAATDINLTATADDIILTAGDDVQLLPTGKLTVTAGENLDFNAGTAVTVDASSGDISLTASDDINITANGDDIILTAADDVQILPTGKMTMTAGENLDFNAGTGITMDASSGNVALTASADVTIDAGDDIILTPASGGEVHFVGNTATIKITDNQIATTTADDLSLVANGGSNDLLVSATNIDIDTSGNIDNHVGSYKFNSGTHYTVVNPCQGMMLEQNDATITNNWLACKLQMDVNGSCIIPFSLPNGAVITRADIKVDVSASSALRVKLMRKGFSYSIDLNADQMDESTGVTGSTTVSLTSISLSTVDTSDFTYYWAIDETAGAGSGAEIGLSKIYFTMDTMAKKFSN